MLQALMDEEKLGRRANPGEARALGPTIPMRFGAALNPLFRRVQDIFPESNPYGSAIENFILGDSVGITERMAEGIPHQLTGAGPNDPIVRPQIVDIPLALPIASTLQLAKAAAVPAVMATGAGLLGRTLKGKKYAPASTEDIASVLLTPALQRQGGALDDAMVAYHGSPHKFGVLDPSKIGTGEGAQAYGHGAYVAESKGVAQTYQPRDFDAEEIMMARYKEAESAGDYNRMEQWENAMLHDTPDDLRKRSLDMDYDEYYRQAAAEVAEELAAIPSTSHLYEIDVPDEDIAKMLDWDAPFNKQPEALKKYIRNLDEDYLEYLFDERWGMNYLPEDMTGGELHRVLEIAYEEDMVLPSSQLDKINLTRDPGGKEAASIVLGEAGIPGIKYYDQGSRAAGEGTRNMVLFDDLARRAKVLKRNDEKIAEPSVDEFIGKLLDDELPLDEASRMQRAKEMGFGEELYHGTGADIDEFKGITWSSESPELANKYAAMRGDMGGDDVVYPIRTKTGESFDADTMPKKVTVDSFANELMVQARKAGRKVDMPKAKEQLAKIRAASAREEEVMARYGDEFDDKLKRYKVGFFGEPRGVARVNPEFDRHSFWFEPESYFGEDGAQAIRDLMRLAGFDSIKMTERGAKTIGVLDPVNVRSKFAKFDPAKKDSAKILAGAAGAGVLSGLYEPDALQDDEAMRRALLRN
jgi:hypothetical protein